ncbi:MAG: response regulator [Gammaproteobacteria bacterium]|jgi:CheY-like chemotaxis protein|nr:response regulator [Gammaproteobacteria bacterium]MBT4605675.1 response regulator [Thiotrichales bacterium]MBT3472024.1 response regulator [Gammaproteobacteria bacterium]MBT3968470.1 response regulator [Gammaproteobacteria bacterium]MBT4079970.1 response regulator [Gammaproteobacteria bacterium]
MSEYSIPVLVIDDDQVLLESYLSILQPQAATAPINYFGDVTEAETAPELELKKEGFLVTTADQGEEGVAASRQAIQEGHPFPLAFIDMRMPPGIDGLETARQLRKLDSRIYIVVVTAFADRTANELHQVLEHDVLLLKKPFVNEEIFQLARNLTQSWQKDRDLEQSVSKSEMEAAYHGGVSEVSSFILHNFGNAIAGIDYYLQELEMAREQIKGLSTLLLDPNPSEEKRGKGPDHTQVGLVLKEFGDHYFSSNLDSTHEVIRYMKVMLENQRNSVKEGTPFWCSDFDIKEVVDEIVAVLEGVMTRLGVRFECNVDDSLQQLHLPKHPLQQLIVSLLKSALDSIMDLVRESDSLPSNHFIKLDIIRLGASSPSLYADSKPSQSAFEVRVTDSGPGFSSAEEKEGIFSSLQRGHVAEGGADLHNIANFVAALKGEIIAQAGENGVGRCFRAHLPTTCLRGE